jgi:hypothetical protein
MGVDGNKANQKMVWLTRKRFQPVERKAVGRGQGNPHTLFLGRAAAKRTTGRQEKKHSSYHNGAGAPHTNHLMSWYRFISAAFIVKLVTSKHVAFPYG